MVQLGILLTQGHRLLSVAAILDVFESVNQLYETERKTPFFNISYVHLPDAVRNVYSAHDAYTPDNAPGLDLILIPAFAPQDIAAALSDNKSFIPWLHMQRQRGAEIASFCTGAFLLAATGLLDKKPATTHVQAADIFAMTFPDVQLKPGEVSTSAQGIYTSGGATNSFHLMLRLLEKYCGHAVAIRTAKYFAIDMNREQQTYFSTFRPVMHHHDALVIDLQRRIENHFDKAGTVEELMTEIPASRRNLARRFKAATGITPIEYLQKTRIEAAKTTLEQTDRSISDVMMLTGYNDLKAFRQQFRKHTGMTPTEYREKFYRKKTIELEHTDVHG